MSNFQNQGKQSECERDILIDFLMSKGFVGEMRMFSDYIELSNDKSFIRIPQQKVLTHAMILGVLQNAGLGYSEFEEHLLSIGRMKSLIDMGLKTPTFRK